MLFALQNRIRTSGKNHCIDRWDKIRHHFELSEKWTLAYLWLILAHELYPRKKALLSASFNISITFFPWTDLIQDGKQDMSFSKCLYSVPQKSDAAVSTKSQISARCRGAVYKINIVLNHSQAFLLFYMNKVNKHRVQTQTDFNSFATIFTHTPFNFVEIQAIGLCISKIL